MLSNACLLITVIQLGISILEILFVLNTQYSIVVNHDDRVTDDKLLLKKALIHIEVTEFGITIDVKSLPINAKLQIWVKTFGNETVVKLLLRKALDHIFVTVEGIDTDVNHKVSNEFAPKLITFFPSIVSGITNHPETDQK